MDFKFSHKPISPIQHELEIELPWEEVEKRISDVLREFRSVVAIDGFRKGKAPLKVVRGHVGEKRILERAADMAAREAFDQASKDLASSPPPPAAPIDLPAQMNYDAHNRMVKYATGTGMNYNFRMVYYDPVGRVFRKERYLGDEEPALQEATEYYYSGNALIQEYDGTDLEDDIVCDYLRGPDGEVIRRREPSEAPEPDRQHYNDPLGTIKGQAKPSRPGNPAETYVTSAEGEPLQAQTTDMASNIRFHGGFLEDKELTTASGSDRGHLYRMGVRHYSPALGRFLQRDPVNNMMATSPESPLGANPYVYGFNDSLQYSDLSGYQGCCQGGTIGNAGGGAGGSSSSEIKVPCQVDWAHETCRNLWACVGECCVDQFGKVADPCHPPVCVPIGSPPKDQWTRCQCYSSCAQARLGGENAPEDGLCGGKYHPAIGYDGSCGSPRLILYNLDYTFGISMQDISSRFNLQYKANISGHIDQLYFAGIRSLDSPFVLDIGKVAGGTVVADAAISVALATFLCRNYGCGKMENDPQWYLDTHEKRYARCMNAHCCEFIHCMENAAYKTLAMMGAAVISSSPYWEQVTGYSGAIFAAQCANALLMGATDCWWTNTTFSFYDFYPYDPTGGQWKLYPHGPMDPKW